MRLAHELAVAARQIADHKAAIVKFGPNRSWDGIGFSHVVEPTRAIDGDAVVEILEGLIDSQFFPQRTDTGGIVHDVAQPKNKPG